MSHISMIYIQNWWNVNIGPIQVHYWFVIRKFIFFVYQFNFIGCVDTGLRWEAFAAVVWTMGITPWHGEGSNATKLSCRWDCSFNIFLVEWMYIDCLLFFIDMYIFFDDHWGIWYHLHNKFVSNYFHLNFSVPSTTKSLCMQWSYFCCWE